NPPLSVQREDRRIQVQADAACLVTLQLADSRLQDLQHPVIVRVVL
ncbi:hypothetical protein HHFLNI_HHFLNI_11135, partial [Dysosmobacter welbionis]